MKSTLQLDQREVAALFIFAAFSANSDRALGEDLKIAFDCADAFLSEVQFRRKKKSKRKRG